MLEPNKVGYVTGVTAIGGHNPREQDYEKLSQIIARLNELFVGEDLTDDDKVNWLNSLASKVNENSGVMDQVRNNSKEQAMLGEFPSAVQNAVISSMVAHKELATQFLADEHVAKGVVDLLFSLIQRASAQHD